MDFFERIAWRAFRALDGTRDVTKVGIYKIKYPDIESWLNLNGITNLEHRQEIAHFVRILDDAYLEGLK